MFSILPLCFLFSLLDLVTVALQSLVDDFSNQASQSLMTANLQQYSMYTVLLCVRIASNSAHAKRIHGGVATNPIALH